MDTSNLCGCVEDGFCARFQRQMRGRFRQICQGIDVDLGTAAAFRAQWAREASGGGASPPPPVAASTGQTGIPLLLKTFQAPGDTVAATAAIYSLHRAYPGRYVTAVETQWPEVFQYNPDVVPAREGMMPVCLSYPGIHHSNDQAVHFMQAWCEFLGAVLGISIPLLTNRPHLYFPKEDAGVEDFWLICAGGKSDFTAKQWGGYQGVVTTLRGEVRFIQVGGAGDNHPHLFGAENMVGKTTLRQLFDLARKAMGVICGVSLLMHVAAALGKPAIVIAGGREPVAWNAYPQQHYLHTIGALPCKSYRGRTGEACWRSRTVPQGDNGDRENDLCVMPVEGLPACMRLITPSAVIRLIDVYTFDSK